MYVENKPILLKMDKNGILYTHKKSLKDEHQSVSHGCISR